MIMCAGKVVWQKAEEDPCKNACQNCQTACEKSSQCGGRQSACQTRCEKNIQCDYFEGCNAPCQRSYQCGNCQKSFQTCGRSESISDS